MLRLCLRYNLADRIPIEQLHREAKLQSIEQRCEFHLLKLLYDYSRNPAHVRQAQRLTRAANKIIFDIPNRCSEKYLNSPLYKGAKIWNILSENTQRLRTKDQFIKM